jgi:hypothetical protein
LTRNLSRRKPLVPPTFRPTLQELEPRHLLSVSVLTAHNDLARTGQNLAETDLTPANVQSATFGRLTSYQVDGQIYTQPLYVPGLTLSDGNTYDVVIVATEHDSVFAFDANGGGQLWQVSFIDPANGITPVPSSELGTSDISPEIGITGTPVIDPATNLLYVVARTKEVRNGTTHYVQRLHAVDITSGTEALTPALIGDTSGSVNVSPISVFGTGAGSVGGVITFNAKVDNERPGLLLLNGVVYSCYASPGDQFPYHGWFIGHDAATLDLVSEFNTTPNASRGQGGIWMSGGAPAVDADGNIYFSTGNGNYNPAVGNIGESAVKMAPDGVSMLDYFTPFNWQALDNGDTDFGSSGVMLLPDQPGDHPHLMVAAGKEGKLYLLDRDNLGGFNAGGDNIVQELPRAINAAFDTPAYFDGGDAGRFVYYGATGDRLKAFQIGDNDLFGTTPASSSSVTFGSPGVTPSVSANGTDNGIVWVVQKAGNAILRAYDALNLSHELYDSEQAGARDRMDGGVKFVAPTIADGKVFVGTAGTLDIFGLLGGNRPGSFEGGHGSGFAKDGGNAIVVSLLSSLRAGGLTIDFGIPGRGNVAITDGPTFSGNLRDQVTVRGPGGGFGAGEVVVRNRAGSGQDDSGTNLFVDPFSLGLEEEAQ